MSKKPVTPEEYRAKSTALVTVSSGFTFKIRKLSKEIMSDFLDIVGIRAAPGVSMEQITKQMDATMAKPEFKEKTFEAMELVIPAGVIEPRIVLEANPVPKDALSLSEIQFGDQLELFMEIVDFQGLPAAAEKFRKRFPRTPRR